METPNCVSLCSGRRHAGSPYKMHGDRGEEYATQGCLRTHQGRVQACLVQCSVLRRSLDTIYKTVRGQNSSASCVVQPKSDK